MTSIFTIVGIALILAAVQDIFFTLFHPAHAGDICDWIARVIWRGFRKLWPSALNMAGPLAFVTIVLYWSVSICIGFALIYLPHLPAAFTFSSGLSPQHYGTFIGALDVSIGSLITLSTGVYSTNLWIQLLMGVESVLGFGLLTASISWILSIYPVLEHRKSLAHEATLLHFSEVKGITRLEEVSDSDLLEILLGLAGQLVTSRNELVQFPITYYFHETETSTSLAGILPYLAETAEWAAGRKGSAGIAGTTLGGAIDDFLKVVAEMFLDRRCINRAELLEAFAYEHLRKQVHSPVRRPRAA